MEDLRTMGYWYWRGLKTGWTLDEGQTNKEDLPDKGHVSGLLIHSQAVNAAALNEYDNKYPIQRHTKIRIVGNGNFEVINLRAKYLQAIGCWDHGRNPVGNYTDVNGLYQRNYFYIPFGRYLGDPDYGLDLAKFASGVELEETNNYSTTYHSDTNCKLDIYMLMRKNPEAGLFGKGFLKKRVIKDKDTASETQYAVKLPTEARLKQIHIFSEPDLSSHVDAVAPTTNVQYIWLGVKSKEEYILQNIRSMHYATYIHEIMKRVFQTRVQCSVGTTTPGLGFADTMLYRAFPHSATPTFDALGDHSIYTKYDDRRICQTWFHAGGSADTVGVGWVVSQGIMLHGDIPLLLQDPMSDESHWLDSKEMGDVYVEVTEGASLGNWRVVLDELEKSYPS